MYFSPNSSLDDGIFFGPKKRAQIASTFRSQTQNTTYYIILLLFTAFGTKQGRRFSITEPSTAIIAKYWTAGCQSDPPL